MFIAKVFRSIFNIATLVWALASVGTLVEMTYGLAVHAGENSKKGFLNISHLNAQILGPKSER